MAIGIVQVAVPVPLYRFFDYLPPAGKPSPPPGSRVLVPFGNRKLVGVVIGRSSASEIDPARVKSIERTFETALVGEELLSLIRWTTRYYAAPPGELVNHALPAVLRRNREMPTSRIHWLHLTPAGAKADLTRAPRQRRHAAAHARYRAARGLPTAPVPTCAGASIESRSTSRAGRHPARAQPLRDLAACRRNGQRQDRGLPAGRPPSAASGSADPGAGTRDWTHTAVRATAGGASWTQGPRLSLRPGGTRAPGNLAGRRKRRGRASDRNTLSGLSTPETAGTVDRRRGARRLLQTVRRHALSRARRGRAARQPAQHSGRPGLGHAVAGISAQCRARTIPDAAVAGACGFIRATALAHRRPARAARRARPDREAGRTDRKNPRRRRAGTGLPEQARLRTGADMQRMRLAG